MDIHGSHDLAFAPLAAEDIWDFLDDSRRAFVEGQIAAGEERAEVEATADAIQAQIVVGGHLNPDHRIGRLMVASEIIGHLWIARDDNSSWYVWDVAIEAEHRGQGLGRAAMKIAEATARSEGATAIGLSVLATNDIACGLYQSLGYVLIDSQGPHLRMIKDLRPLDT